jgi:LPS-assembly protein
MIKNIIEHLRSRSAGVQALVAVIVLLPSLSRPLAAAVLSEQSDQYQWRLCPAGRLIPLRPGYTDASTDPASTEIRAETSRLVAEGMSQFSGDVEIVRGRNAIRAEVVTYEDATGIFNASGRTHLWDGSLIWAGESATYDLNSEVSSLYEGRYWLQNGRGRGHAGYLQHDRPADVTILTDVDYSTCPLSDEAWRISAAKIKLDHKSDRGSATNAILRVRDIPVFYFPYVNFPISDKRKSGFLAPVIGSSNDSGSDVRVPYYWNMAPNYDATITPRILGDRGVMLGTELRHKGQRSRSEANVEYLPGDDLRNGEDRSFVALSHQQSLFRGRGRLRGVFNNVSDDEYFEDFGRSISATSQRFLNRQLSFRYAHQGTRINALAQSYQTVDNTIAPSRAPYRRLPQVTVDHNFRKIGNFLPSISSENTYFERDGTVGGGRLMLAPALSYEYIRPHISVVPKFTLNHTQYLLDDPDSVFDDNESRSVATFSLDTKLFMERQFSLFGQNHLQTFEPRLFYLAVPNVDQGGLPRFDGREVEVSFRNIFRENRFTGGDRIGDANQVTAAVTSRLLDTENGREAMRISIGQIYYFRDRKVTLPGATRIDDSLSELVAEAAANLGPDWNLRGTLQWDPNEPRTEKSAIALRYRPNLETVVNLSYRFRRANTDIEQTDVSMRLPLTDSLSFVGHWNYSLPEKRSLDTVAGIEFESCCWGLRLVARRFLRNSEGAFDNGIFLQVQFRGLGAFGRESRSFLRRGIPGYEDPFD